MFKRAMSITKAAEEEPIEFVSLGMFILDNIRQSDGTTLGEGLIGGAGTYALIGARLFNPLPRSKRLFMVVDMGNDFPSSVEERLKSFNCAIHFRPTPQRQTTWSENTYGPGEMRNFRYLTPKLQVNPNDLTPQAATSKTFHIISNPIRAKSVVNDILLLRETQGIKERPMFIWEPYPDVCVPDNWEDCLNAMKVVDFISPNVHEAAAFLGQTIDEDQPLESFKADVERLLGCYTSCQIGDGGAIVLRCGKHGCVISNGETVTWLPAFHESKDKVVDPTGGGNAFCGGFCVGWLQSGGDLVTAGIYGNISASFIIEQYGLPALEVGEDQEIWNGDTVEQRRAAYEERLK